MPGHSSECPDFAKATPGRRAQAKSLRFPKRRENLSYRAKTNADPLGLRASG